MTSQNHRMTHSRQRVEGGWETTWTCETCGRTYKYGPDTYQVIVKGEYWIPHSGMAGTGVFKGFNITGMRIDDTLPDQFSEFLDGLA